MQQPEWKGAKPQRFSGGRVHIRPEGELTSTLQPNLSTIGACGIRTFSQRISDEASFKPHVKIYPDQYRLSSNEIDLRGKKYVELGEQKPRVRPEKSHVSGGMQTTNQFVPRGIKTFEESAYLSQNFYELENVMQQKTRINDFEAKRNNIGVSSLGDKPYKYPQYSVNFYKEGGLIPGSTFRPLPQDKKQTNKNEPVLKKPNWDVRVKMDEIEEQRKYVNSIDDWQQTTLKQANPNWNDPDTFFQRMEAKKETKDQKKAGKK